MNNAQRVPLLHLVSRPGALARSFRLLFGHIAKKLKEKSGFWYAAVIFSLLVFAGLSYCSYMVVITAQAAPLPPERKAFGIVLPVVAVVAGVALAIGFFRSPVEPNKPIKPIKPK